MGTRSNPSVFDAYRTADEDEPLFTLKASDPQAPALVMQWARDRLRATQLGQEPAADLDKVIEAMEVAEAMREWRTRKEVERQRPKAKPPYNPGAAATGSVAGG